MQTPLASEDGAGSLLFWHGVSVRGAWLGHLFAETSHLSCTASWRVGCRKPARHSRSAADIRPARTSIESPLRPDEFMQKCDQKSGEPISLVFGSRPSAKGSPAPASDRARMIPQVLMHRNKRLACEELFIANVVGGSRTAPRIAGRAQSIRCTPVTKQRKRAIDLTANDRKCSRLTCVK